MKHNIKTLSIKTNLANDIRKLLYKTNITKNNLFQNKKQFKELSDLDKINSFEKIWNLTKETNSELHNYKLKRKYKAKIRKEREERGWVPKKKTSLKEYQKSKISF